MRSNTGSDRGSEVSCHSGTNRRQRGSNPSPPGPSSQRKNGKLVLIKSIFLISLTFTLPPFPEQPEARGGAFLGGTTMTGNYSSFQNSCLWNYRPHVLRASRPEENRLDFLKYQPRARDEHARHTEAAAAGSTCLHHSSTGSRCCPGDPDVSFVTDQSHTGQVQLKHSERTIQTIFHNQQGSFATSGS